MVARDDSKAVMSLSFPSDTVMNETHNSWFVEIENSNLLSGRPNYCSWQTKLLLLTDKLLLLPHKTIQLNKYDELTETF